MYTIWKQISKLNEYFKLWLPPFDSEILQANLKLYARITIFISMYIYLSIYIFFLSISSFYLHIYSFYLSIYESIFPPFHLSTYPSFYQSCYQFYIHISVYLSTFLIYVECRYLSDSGCIDILGVGYIKLLFVLDVAKFQRL